MLEIKNALENAKNLYNLIRLYGHFELLEKIDFKKLNELYNETARHLDIAKSERTCTRTMSDTTNLLNVALENVILCSEKFQKKKW